MRTKTINGKKHFAGTGKKNSSSLKKFKEDERRSSFP